MRRVAFALLFCAVSALSFTSHPAQAGDWGYYDGPRYSRYYDGDYDRPHYRPYRSHRGYSSDCCYSRVSYYRRVSYDRPHRSYYDRPYYRASYDRPYYDRPYHGRYSYDSGWYYGRPYYTHYSSYRLPSYYRDYYYDGPRYSSYYGGYGYRSYRPYYSSYSSYDYGYRSTSLFGRSHDPYTRAAYPYDQPRRYYPEGCRRSKIYDDAGGYVWGNGLSCGH